MDSFDPVFNASDFSHIDVEKTALRQEILDLRSSLATAREALESIKDTDFRCPYGHDLIAREALSKLGGEGEKAH